MSFDLGTRTELVPNGDCSQRRDTARAMSNVFMRGPIAFDHAGTEAVLERLDLAKGSTLFLEVVA